MLLYVIELKSDLNRRVSFALTHHHYYHYCYQSLCPNKQERYIIIMRRFLKVYIFLGCPSCPARELDIIPQIVRLCAAPHCAPSNRTLPRSIASVSGDLSSLTAPPFILSPVSLTEFPGPLVLCLFIVKQLTAHCSLLVRTTGTFWCYCGSLHHGSQSTRGAEMVHRK